MIKPSVRVYNTKSQEFDLQFASNHRAICIKTHRKVAHLTGQNKSNSRLTWRWLTNISTEKPWSEGAKC